MRVAEYFTLWAKGTSVWLYCTASSCHDMLCGPKCKTQKQTLTPKSQLFYWKKKKQDRNGVKDAEKTYSTQEPRTRNKDKLKRLGYNIKIKRTNSLGLDHKS